MSNAAAPAPPHDVAPPLSCFSEWLSRTPLLCKAAVLLITLPSLLAFAFGASGALLLFPQSVFSGQVWRFLTAPFVQGDFLGVLFCAVVFAVQVPPSELKVGTLAFFLHVAGSSALINVAFVLAAGALGTLPWAPLSQFLITPGNGAWPVLIMMLTERALADPAGSTPFCCFSILNPYFGWALASFFSLFAFFPMLDMFIAVGLAHARAFRSRGGGAQRRADSPLTPLPPHTPRALVPLRQRGRPEFFKTVGAPPRGVGDDGGVAPRAPGRHARSGLRVRTDERPPLWAPRRFARGHVAVLGQFFTAARNERPRHW